MSLSTRNRFPGGSGTLPHITTSLQNLHFTYPPDAFMKPMIIDELIITFNSRKSTIISRTVLLEIIRNNVPSLIFSDIGNCYVYMISEYKD